MEGGQKITDLQRQMLIDKFHSGMNRCNKETLHLREAASSAAGLSLKSINVGELSLAGYV